MHRARAPRVVLVGLGAALAAALQSSPAMAEPAAPAATATEPAPTNDWLAPTIVMGVGAILATTGIVYFLTANQHYPDSCSETTKLCSADYYHALGITDADGAGWRVALDRQKQDDYERHHRIGFGLAVSGAAVTAGGLAWLLLARPISPKTAIAPWVDVGRGGVTLRGSF